MILLVLFIFPITYVNGEKRAEDYYLEGKDYYIKGIRSGKPHPAGQGVSGVQLKSRTPIRRRSITHLHIIPWVSDVVFIISLSIGIFERNIDEDVLQRHIVETHLHLQSNVCRRSRPCFFLRESSERKTSPIFTLASPKVHQGNFEWWQRYLRMKTA